MENDKIKHIVCSGGGVSGFSFYGAIRESFYRGEWQMENIESIYGTSIGSILAVILSLKYDWATIDDYLLKRPWQNVYKFNMYTLFDCIQKMGIFNIKVIEETFLPLFKGKDMSIDITMKEFFELTKIDVHLVTTDLHKFETIDISYKTHPDWRIVDAVYCSCALPIVFSPIFKDEKCYCDGGFLNNYPIDNCINNGADPNEIMGLTIAPDNPESTANQISTLFDYIIMIINKLIGILLKTDRKKLAIEYIIYSPAMSMYDIYNIVSSMDERNRLINIGVESVNLCNSGENSKNFPEL